MASALVFLLAIGGACAIRMVAVVQHPPDSFDRHQRPHCDSMSSHVDYYTENFCTNFFADHGSWQFQCVGTNVLARRFTDQNCQQADPHWNTSSILSGCQPGFPVSNFFSCIDSEYVQPTSFKSDIYVHYNYITGSNCNASALEYVTGHRMNTCYLDNSGRSFLHTCAGTSLNITYCQDRECNYNCMSDIKPPGDNCNNGDIFHFTCPTPPPSPPSSAFVYGQVVQPTDTTCTNTAAALWVNGYNSGSCVFFGHMGNRHPGGPMYGQSFQCPPATNPNGNVTVTGFMDNLCTWPWGQFSFAQGCEPAHSPMIAPIKTTCATVPPWNNADYYFRNEYDSTCTNIINIEGRRYNQCYPSLEWPNTYWKHVCNVPGLPNAVVSYNCTDIDCHNCQLMEVDPILDFCDFRNTKVSAPQECKSNAPHPPAPPSAFYARSMFYTTQDCSAYSVWSVARQGGMCNLAGSPFGHGGFPMPEWITYNTTHIIRNIYADYGCNRPLFTEADPLGCGQSRFDNQMYELRQQVANYNIPYMITNASYPNANCNGQPDLVDLIEENVCNPVVGGWQQQEYIQFTCNAGQMTYKMCADAACSRECFRNYTTQSGCVNVGGGRSFMISCAARPLPPGPPPSPPPTPTPPGPPVGPNPGGEDDWRKKRHEAEVIPIGIITGIAGIAVIVLTISGYRKLRAGGYSEL